MTSGPIEFLSDGEIHETPSTEFGGADGLIQPLRGDLLPGDPDASGGHKIVGDDVVGGGVERERAGMMMRYATRGLGEGAQVTGEDEDAGMTIDPATGRAEKTDDLSGAGGAGSGELSSLKP